MNVCTLVSYTGSNNMLQVISHSWLWVVLVAARVSNELWGVLQVAVNSE